MKLYEVLLRKIGLWGCVSSQPAEDKAQEDLAYNPIGCKIGGVVKVDSLDFRDHRFTVREIRANSITLGPDTYCHRIDGWIYKPSHRMVDYVLLARPIGKPDFTCRLRIVPNPDSQSKTTHRALLMTLYDDLAYNEGLHEAVKDDTKKFVVDDDTDPNNIIHDEFWRVNDVGISYFSNVKILADLDRSGKVDKNEISRGSVEFWDYSRMTLLDGVEVEEFVFVEMDKKDGWFKIWRGSEINPERIDVF